MVNLSEKSFYCKVVPDELKPGLTVGGGWKKQPRFEF